MARLFVKNWKEFQHYKDRNPSWIKLHKRFLDDYVFHRLQLASRALAPMIWLLASESEDGSIEYDLDEIAFRVHSTKDEVNNALTPLIDAGFIYVEQVASEPLADCKQSAIPEKRREEKRETALASVLADSDAAILICRELNFSGMKLPREITEAIPTIKAALGFHDNAEVLEFLPEKWRAYEASTKFKMGFEKWLAEARWKEGEKPRVNGKAAKTEGPYERTQRELREG